MVVVFEVSEVVVMMVRLVWLRIGEMELGVCMRGVVDMKRNSCGRLVKLLDVNWCVCGVVVLLSKVSVCVFLRKKFEFGF